MNSDAEIFESSNQSGCMHLPNDVPVQHVNAQEVTDEKHDTLNELQKEKEKSSQDTKVQEFDFENHNSLSMTQQEETKDQSIKPTDAPKVKKPKGPHEDKKIASLERKFDEAKGKAKALEEDIKKSKADYKLKLKADKEVPKKRLTTDSKPRVKKPKIVVDEKESSDEDE